MTNPQSIQVSLDGPEAEFLASCLSTGRYPSASEAVREGLRLLERHHTELQAEYARIRELIQVGADQLDRGEVIDADVAFRLLDEQITAFEAEQDNRAGPE